MCRNAASLDHTQNKAHDNVREIFMIRVRREGGWILEQAAEGGPCPS